MQILITGAAGMLGSRLTRAIMARGDLRGSEISGLTLVDIEAPPLPVGVPGAALSADLSEPAAASALVEARPDVIFHLAAVVSGAAEADTGLGYAVNLSGTAALLQAVAAEPDYAPRLVFASSLAVFGAPLPDVIGDDVPPRPLTSYGTQKRMGELMVDDLSRKGALDGVSLRLPTVCVRPGAPNAAASGFWSSILREPLVGRPATVPVPEDTRHWFASPRAAVGFLIRAAEIDTSGLGRDRALNLPGVSATVTDALAALERLAGPEAVARVAHVPDERVQAIVGGWPRAFDPARARALGFEADADMDAILRAHVEDELGGRISAV
jgi:nucleoside-diphosphate-sugar epimerase